MNLTPEMVLTPEGIVAFASLIAVLTQIVKRVPSFGAWLNAGREPGFVLTCSVVVVIYSALASAPQWDLSVGFTYFMAWISIAGLSTKAYDVSPNGLKTALGGHPTQ